MHEVNSRLISKIGFAGLEGLGKAGARDADLLSSSSDAHDEHMADIQPVVGRI